MPSGVYKRKPRTPEHCAALSKAAKGIPKSPEHCAAISKAKTGVPLSPEHCDAITKAKIDVPLSPEHIAAITKGIRNSDAVKAYNESMRGVPRSPEHIAAIIRGQEESGANDAMRGGYDIVDHHYIYDHANPEKYTMKVTRSKHGQIHAWMRKAGIKVPHINTE